jgi:predicted patatin/cPLA2 family phospholipase
LRVQKIFETEIGAMKAGLLRAGRLSLHLCGGLLLVILALGGCSGLKRVPPAPQELGHTVSVLGLSNARFWPDTQGAALAQEALDALQRERRAAGLAPGRTEGLPPAYFLAVSGGGDNGAFGSGLLCGWQASGTIPSFKLVTGVSTGALIAPFAFLGRPYHDKLCSMYTTIKPTDILESRGIYGALFEDALADTSPLARLISQYMTEQTLADIAREYQKGRLLLVGTTNLDVQRPVIWNIGAIAASGRPEALDLVRKILRASAAIPGAFPPVMIDIEADGQRYQEMNVDGGAVAQTFLYPADLGLRTDMRAPENARERHAYIIRNGRLDPDWAATDRQFLPIVGRAIATMIHYSGYNDILRIYAITQRDGVDYNLAYIGPDFLNTKHEEFDPTYLRALFDYGYAKGLQGYNWHKAPPLLQIKD